MTNEPDTSSHEAETLAPEEQNTAGLISEHPPCSQEGKLTGSAGVETNLADEANRNEPVMSQKAETHMPAITPSAVPPPPATAETFGSPLIDCNEGEGKHRPGYDSPLDKEALERSMSSVSKIAHWGTPSTAGSAGARSKGPAEGHGSGKVAPPKDGVSAFGLSLEADDSANCGQASAPPPTPVTAAKSNTGRLVSPHSKQLKSVSRRTPVSWGRPDQWILLLCHAALEIKSQ